MIFINKTMKNFVLSLLIGIFSFLSFSSVLVYGIVSAEEASESELETEVATLSTSIPCPLPAELCDMRSAISLLTRLIVPAAGLVLLLMIIYAGFTKLTAAGDAEKEKKSMQILKASIIGFAIIALSGVIVGTIGGFFGFNILSP